MYFLKFLAKCCNLIAISGYCHDMCGLSVCRLSVVQRIYCDKTAEVRIMQFFFIKMKPNASAICLPSLMTKFDEVLSIGGSN